MLNKKIGAAILAAVILGGMTGCAGNTDSGSTADNISSTISDNSDNEQSSQATAENSVSENDGAENILNLGLSSGYVKIGDDLFQNGGYITVSEFISEYGNKYDVSSIDVNKEVDEDWFFRYYITRNDSEDEIGIQCGAPVSGSGVVGDAVIVSFIPEEADALFASDLGRYNQMEESDIISLYESYGCVYSELDDRNEPISKRFPAADNAGKYVQHKTDKSNIIAASIELDLVNLYGVKPKLLYMFSDYGDENNYFSVLEVNYNGGTSITIN